MRKIAFSFLLALASASAGAQNPYLPLWEHLPDGEPRVFEDPDAPGKYRAYIIGSHDISYDRYCGNDIRMWSAPVEDLSQWRDEGPIFSWFVNGQWDTMYAPDLVEVNDRTTGKKTYWLYPHSRGWRRVAMVCKSDRPDGPFTPVNLTPDGTQCVPGSLIDFDPSVFVETITDKRDKDYDRGFRAYVYYGFRHSTAFELDPDNMYAVRPGTEIHDYFIPASERYGEIRDPEGTEYPALYKDQNPGDFNFFEASSIRKVGNKYIMVFSGYSGPDYGLGSTNSALRYAYGDSPLGPWRSGGVLVDSRGVVPNHDGSHLTTTNAAHNTHGSLQEINGQWYVFYHITAYDPYAKNNEWTAAASDGTEYKGAEVTSEGFQIFGLPPYRYYSAGIACYMTGNDWLQDNHDVWHDGMDLKDITDGGIVGFKYFGFGGLDKDAKGVKAFRGTLPGDGTRLSLNLTPDTKQGFRIRVMLDGPYANDTWHGREIAVVDVPVGTPKEARSYEVAVPGVEGLKGKHAIYLVAEGPDCKFTLHGIGFAKEGMQCTPPAVPSVEIYADGKKLNIPATPVRCTNANGLTDAIRYQLYAPITDSSKLEVKSDGAIDIEIGKITDGRATIKCSYNGNDKLFLIN